MIWLLVIIGIEYAYKKGKEFVFFNSGVSHTPTTAPATINDNNNGDTDARAPTTQNFERKEKRVFGYCCNFIGATLAP